MIRIEISAVTYRDGLQLVSGRTSAGEYVKEAVRAQGHGLSAHPPLGSIGYVAFLGDRRDMPVIQGIEHPDKTPTDMKAGNVTLYDHQGNALALKDDAATLSHKTKAVVSAAGVSVELRDGKVIMG